MEILTAVLLVLAGLTEGLLAGVFDAGGGIVLVPVLLYYLHSIGVSSLVSTHVAMGTSLLVLAFASAFRTWREWRASHVIWQGAFYVIAGGIPGAIVGVSIAAGLEGPSLRAIFGFVLLVAAVRLFSGKRKQGKELEPRVALRPLGGIGIAVGLVSSLSGIGGTLLAVPLMSKSLHFPLRKAIGTANAAVVFTAAAGAMMYLIRGWGNVLLPAEISGFIDWRPAIPLLMGAVPGGMIGTRLGAKVDVASVRNAVGVLLLVVMLRMFFL